MVLMSSTAAAAPLARPKMDHPTSEAVTQPGERLELASFSCDKASDKPMMEMKAGSNRWYQAHVVAESHNEIQVVFPAVDKHSQPVLEWCDRGSSRIWRGSLSGDVWKYLSNGAWAPKASAGGKALPGRGFGGPRKRPSKHQSTELSDSGLASEAPDSGHAAASGRDASSPEASAAQGAAARRRSSRKRIAVHNADDADDTDVHNVLEPCEADAHQARGRRPRNSGDSVHSEPLVRWFQGHARALGSALGPTPSNAEAGGAPSRSASTLDGPVGQWSKSLPDRVHSCSVPPGRPGSGKSMRDLESSSESDLQLRKLGRPGSAPQPVQGAGRFGALLDPGQRHRPVKVALQPPASHALKSPWLWHTTARPAQPAEAPAADLGPASRSGSLSSLAAAARKTGEQPHENQDLSSKSTSTPGGHMPQQGPPKKRLMENQGTWPAAVKAEAAPASV